MFRFVLQRAREAEVVIEGRSCGRVESGLMIFMGIGRGEIPTGASLDSLLEKLSDKILGLRIFEDEHGKMNRSVLDVRGGVYLVSQFTLFADCRKGMRPGFSQAAPPDEACALYERFLSLLKRKAPIVYSGEFAADMKVHLVNDGPVTILLEADSEGIR